MNSKFSLIKILLLIFSLTMVGCTASDTEGPAEISKVPSFDSGTQGDTTAGEPEAPTAAAPEEEGSGLLGKVDPILIHPSTLTIIDLPQSIDQLHDQYATHLGYTAEEKEALIVKAWEKYMKDITYIDGNPLIDPEKFLMFVLYADRRMTGFGLVGYLAQVKLFNKNAHDLLTEMENTQNPDLLEKFKKEIELLADSLLKIRPLILDAAKIYGIKFEEVDMYYPDLNSASVNIQYEVNDKIKSIFGPSSCAELMNCYSYNGSLANAVRDSTFAFTNTFGEKKIFSIINFGENPSLVSGLPLFPGMFGYIPIAYLNFVNKTLNPDM